MCVFVFLDKIISPINVDRPIFIIPYLSITRGATTGYHTSYIKNKGLFNGMNQSILRRNFFTLTVEMYNKIIIIKAIASIIISPP